MKKSPAHVRGLMGALAAVILAGGLANVSGADESYQSRHRIPTC